MGHRTVYRPIDDGDYSGRGDWANNTVFCEYVHRYFRGKRLSHPVRCRYPAQPGHTTCEHHHEKLPDEVLYQ